MKMAMVEQERCYIWHTHIYIIRCRIQPTAIWLYDDDVCFISAMGQTWII
jgi:hypothetical protein